MADDSKDSGALGGLPHFPKEAQDIPDQTLPEEKYSRWIPVLALAGAIVVPVFAIALGVPLGLELTIVTAVLMVAGGALTGAFLGWLVEERRKDVESRRRRWRE
jgi:hypothetical protein